MLLARCAPPDQGLIINLRTDFVPAVEFDALRVWVEGGESREVAVRASERFSRARYVTTFLDVPRGQRRVVMALSLGGVEFTRRTHDLPFSGSYLDTFTIERSCLGVECSVIESCRGRVCVPATCITGEEPSCPPPQCTDDSMCMTTTACVSAECASGVCLETPDDALCPADRLCVPAQGCVSGACTRSTRWWIGSGNERVQLAVDGMGNRYVSVRGSMETRPAGTTDDFFLARIDADEGYAWVAPYAAWVGASERGVFTGGAVNMGAQMEVNLDELDPATGAVLRRIGSLRKANAPSDRTFLASGTELAVLATIGDVTTFETQTITTLTQGRDVGYVLLPPSAPPRVGFGGSAGDDRVLGGVFDGSTLLMTMSSPSAPLCFDSVCSSALRQVARVEPTRVSFEEGLAAVWAVDGAGNRYGLGTNNRLRSTTREGAMRWESAASRGENLFAVSPTGRLFAAVEAFPSEMIAGHMFGLRDSGAALLELDPATGRPLRVEVLQGPTRVLLGELYATNSTVYLSGHTDTPFGDCGAAPPTDSTGDEGFLVTWQP